jgi:hypothetical protein
VRFADHLFSLFSHLFRRDIIEVIDGINSVKVFIEKSAELIGLIRELLQLDPWSFEIVQRNVFHVHFKLVDDFIDSVHECLSAIVADCKEKNRKTIELLISSEHSLWHL